MSKSVEAITKVCRIYLSNYIIRLLKWSRSHLNRSLPTQGDDFHSSNYVCIVYILFFIYIYVDKHGITTQSKSGRMNKEGRAMEMSYEVYVQRNMMYILSRYMYK